MSTQAQFTLQLFAFIGNLACLLLCIHHMEHITCLRSTVQTENLNGSRRTGNFDTGISFVEHSFYLSVIGSRQHDIAFMQSPVLHQYGSNVSTPFIQSGLDNRTSSPPVGIRF